MSNRQPAQDGTVAPLASELSRHRPVTRCYAKNALHYGKFHCCRVNRLAVSVDNSVPKMITKIQAAEHQLDTAIRLFFENIDHLSSYTLAAASREITDDLCEKKSHELFHQELERLGNALEVRLSFREEMKIYIKDQYYKAAMAAFRKVQNFLKHADKDPDGEIDDLRARELAFVIWTAGRNYVLLERRVTPALSIFLHWFGAAEPKILKKPKNAAQENFLGSLEKLRGNIPDLYSAESLKVMHVLLLQNG
jgi:hypothetical protein